MAPLPAFEPQDANSAAAMLAQAAADGIAVVPHGNRTKLRWAIAGERTASLSSLRLTSGLAHYSGDLVATAPAGCTLREVNAALALERQWLPLDPPCADRATIGGIVAANASGPRRHRVGSPRDLIIGIEVALTSGRVAHSGGRVVKNVAGYDLARLFCGSQGSLGVITSVTFKLAPIAAASRTVVARFASVQRAAAFGVELSAVASLTPSAIELVAPDPRLLVRFETTERSAELMAAGAAAHLATGATDVVTLDGDAEADVWAAHQQLESADTGLVALVVVLPAAVGGALDVAHRLATECGVTFSANGRAALGVLRVHATGDGAPVQRFAGALRLAIGSRGGHVRFTGDPTLIGEQIEAVGTAAAVGFAVKRQFDPTGVLPYPWARG